MAQLFSLGHIYTMSQHLRYLVLAIGFSGICWGWCRVGAFIYRISSVAASEEGVKFPDSSFVAISVGWSIIFVGILFVMFWSWKRVLKPQTRDLK